MEYFFADLGTEVVIILLPNLVWLLELLLEQFYVYYIFLPISDNEFLYSN